MGEYLFPVRKLTNKFSSISSKEDLQNFVQERSAHVTQTDKKNLKKNDAEEIFLNIINKELENGLDKNIYENVKNEFILKSKNIDWHNYYQNNPFKDSGLALYKWSPIADELKVLDKEIVLNSIKLKWNLVENEFKDLSKNLSFN